MKVFISSTCYDLGKLRDSLKREMASLGYEPILSEQGDVFYNPREHTHISCVKSVKESDIVICIIGRRFGGEAVHDALKLIKIPNDSEEIDFFENFNHGKISISQVEVLYALQNNILVYPFIEKVVFKHHEQYIKSKDKKAVLNELESRNKYKKRTTKYIFDFFDYIRHMEKNNAFFQFSNVDEIIKQFRKQNIANYQYLLKEETKRAVNKDAESKNLISALVIETKSEERNSAFSDLFLNVGENKDIWILGTGVTNFLNDSNRITGLLKTGNKIKVLLMNDKIIRNDLDHVNENSISLLELLNFLVEKSHFLNYYGKGKAKGRREKKWYLNEMKRVYNLCDEYKKLIIEQKLSGTFDFQHFYSFVPMSMNAIFSDASDNKRLIVEFIIPFTEKRILLKSSSLENPQIFETFKMFFNDTWEKTQKKTKKVKKSTSMIGQGIQ